MKIPTRARTALWKLQTELQEAVEERNAVLQALSSGWIALTPDSRREMWLEFSWLDHEYRLRVIRLGQLCEQITVRATRRS